MPLAASWQRAGTLKVLTEKKKKETNKQTKESSYQTSRGYQAVANDY